MTNDEYFDAAMAKNLRRMLQDQTGGEWRQEDFAKAVNVGTRTVAGWESTKENSPKHMTTAARKNCVSLARTYGIDLSSLEVKK